MFGSLSILDKASWEENNNMRALKMSWTAEDVGRCASRVELKERETPGDFLLATAHGFLTEPINSIVYTAESSSSLWGADLTGANLSGADLLGAQLEEANLEGAVVTGTILDGQHRR
jgi:uncharacterized protein YjbI with pentapeptide repeats